MMSPPAGIADRPRASVFYVESGLLRATEISRWLKISWRAGGWRPFPIADDPSASPPTTMFCALLGIPHGFVRAEIPCECTAVRPTERFEAIGAKVSCGANPEAAER